MPDRNRTSHAYNEETADDILRNIRLEHHALLKALEKTLLARGISVRWTAAYRLLASMLSARCLSVTVKMRGFFWVFECIDICGEARISRGG
jgi:hypothetical protein